MKRGLQSAFTGLAVLALTACAWLDPAPQPMGPVRLVEKKIEIPAAAFECRALPAAPADYFDGLEHAEWLTSLWFTAVDCSERLRAAGELVGGKQE